MAANEAEALHSVNRIEVQNPLFLPALYISNPVYGSPVFIGPSFVPLPEWNEEGHMKEQSKLFFWV